MKTKGGKIVAGFTKAKWNADGVSDKKKSKDAFILQLNTTEKYVSKLDNQTIVCNEKWGPVFGSGGDNCDLAIGDNCHVTKNCFSTFPS